MNNTCVIAVKNFCNICGQFILAGHQTRPISLNLEEIYSKYFGRKYFMGAKYRLPPMLFEFDMQWRQSCPSSCYGPSREGKKQRDHYNMSRERANKDTETEFHGVTDKFQVLSLVFAQQVH